MFGHKDVQTTATVVAVSETSSKVEVNGRFKYEVVLDVSAVDGPAFRTTVEERFFPISTPDAGDVVQVKYDPKSHKTEMLTEGDPRYDLDAADKLQQQQGRAQVEAAMSQPAGTPLAAPMSGPAGSPPPAAFTAADSALAQLAELERSGATVQTSNQVIDASKVPGLKEAILAALQSHGINVPAEGVTMTPAPVAPATPAAMPPSTSAGTTPPQSTADRIQHLTMLRDAGLLTPDEFETLQKKVLAEG